MSKTGARASPPTHAARPQHPRPLSRGFTPSSGTARDQSGRPRKSAAVGQCYVLSKDVRGLGDIHVFTDLVGVLHGDEKGFALGLGTPFHRDVWQQIMRPSVLMVTGWNWSPGRIHR